MYDKITASMCTMPSRLWHLSESIGSICGQVDVVRLVLNGFDNDQLGLVQELVAPFPNVQIVALLDNSLRDCAKFWNIDQVDGFVLIIDDDIKYPANFVSVMMKHLDKMGRCAVSVMGKTLQPRPVKSYYKGVETNYRALRDVFGYHAVDVIGTCGMLYHSRDCDMNHQYCKSPNSDLWFSKWCKDNGLPKYVVPHAAEWLVNLGDSTDGIWFDYHQIGTHDFMTEFVNKYI